ncbi:MAG: aminomethyl-transferring glycine dehydrogenase subunit GcvPA [Candidatus Lokiarchaeota archaeon]|nr:aminomethyl-transferring glycine dehydrogenase subunit GcvPA [Candidatus Lokiarchaeota archaeon]
MDFVPHDKKTIAEMLSVIGVNDIDELFQDIPNDLIKEKLNLPQGLSEPDLLRHMEKISKRNKTYSSAFIGAGCYFHYIPSVVNFVISRSEFYTSYTPYQAEASQGYLQAIYEYQTIISKLTQMDIANASMYDGSTALAEAAIMATLITNKQTILMLEGIHPEYVEVVKTYCWGQDIAFEEVSEDKIMKRLNENVAAFLFQSPNFFGDVEDVSDLVEKVRKKAPNCLLIQAMTDPTCLGVINPPGLTDVDIFVAEGQSFGISPSFGGPGLGIFTAKKKFLRKIPGRLIGKTKEINGTREGFILTLQAREQHIRREKASSNICTNQALCSLAALVYLLSMGKTGLKEIASQNFQKAHYLKSELSKIPGYKILNTKPTYNEFLLSCLNVDLLIYQCKQRNLLPPLNISKYYPKMKNIALVCVTEMNSRESIENFLQAAQEAITNTKEGEK